MGIGQIVKFYNLVQNFCAQVINSASYITYWGISMEKKCAVCKKTFTTFDAKSKYCSSACAKKAGKAK